MWARERIGDATCEAWFDKMPTKDRPRFTKTGRAYTSHQTEANEKAIKAAWLAQVGTKWASHEGQVCVQIIAERPLAKSDPKKDAGKAYVLKPDVDNICKAILDALNGVAYRDDKQVTEIHVVKMPRVPHRGKCRVVINASYFKETFRKDTK